MKALVSIMALVFAGSVSATTINADVFNTNVSIKKGSLKCSLVARKLKMKLNGLEALGKMGKRNFKSVRTYGESCNTVKGRLLEQLDSRRGPLDAGILVNESEVSRTVWRNNNDFGRVFPYINVAGTNLTQGYPFCETYRVKKVAIKLAQVTLGNLPIELERVEEKFISTDYGPCR